MRYRREQQYQQLNRKNNNEEDCSWNSIIIWGVCISVVVLIILYVSFGPNLVHQQPVVVTSQQVSTLDEDKKQIPVFESTINIESVGEIFYRHAEPRGDGKHVQVDILLLHGAKYGSQTWKGVGTIQILAYWGFRTFAIDLPGYKLSKKATPPETQNGKKEFMEKVIEKLRMKKVVIVAPSMSGTYGLPILLEDNNVDLSGFIAIAPQSTNKYSKQQYQSVNVPVLVMYGERDNTPYKDESIYWMENIPMVTNVMVARAEHAAFVGNPAKFHEEILRFLAAECKLGEDTEEIYDEDTNFDGDTFANYERDTDTSDNYYGDTDSATEDQDYVEFLNNFFAGNDDTTDSEVYYDDTELYYDNKDLTEDKIIDTDADIDSYAGIGEEGGDTMFAAIGDS